MVLRDQEGEVIFAACRSLHYCKDATEAELKAIEERLRLSLQRMPLNFTLESDCAEAIELIKGDTPNSSIYAFSISVIRELLRKRSINIVKIDRKANTASHE